MISITFHNKSKATTSKCVTRCMKNFKINGAKREDLIICNVIISNSGFRQRNSVTDRCFLCERLQEGILWVQIPVYIKVLLQCRDMPTVVEMSMCVEKCDNLPFNVFGLFQCCLLYTSDAADD